MRFISKFGRYGVSIRPILEEHFATGIAKVIQTPIFCQFEPGDLRPEERELAIARWTWNGFYQSEDEVTVVPPDYRIGVFDTERQGWSDEERELAERELCRLAEIDDSNFMVVPRTTVPPPWPRYDDFAGSPAELAERLVEDGHDLQKTLEYETAMQNRPEVVAAIQDAQAGGSALVDFDPHEEVIVG